MLPGSSFVGHGEIWHKQRYIATVDYRMQLWQLPGDNEDVPRCPQLAEPNADLATGSIIVVSGEMYLPVGDICALKVETGHECRVYLDPQGVGSGYYHVSLLDITDLR